MTGLLPLLVKKLAEGDFGQGLANIYWFLAGKKLYISIAIGLIALGLDYLFGLGVCDSCGGYKELTLKIAGILAVIGLYDGAIRADKPEKPDA